MHKHYRAIFLSDWHMGAKKFNAFLLLDFLRKNDSDMLYLIGDIIDGWKLNKRWYWPDVYSAILDELLRKKSNGTEIVYVTGNHDEELRAAKLSLRFRLFRNSGFRIVNEISHRTRDDKKFIVIHGDQFDRKILRGTLSRATDKFYALLYDFFHKDGPYIDIKGRRKRFSLAKAVNATGQKALAMLSNFEKIACAYATRHHADGIICGHTHIPSLNTRRSVVYANSGGWLRDLHTAIVETDTGALDLIEWSAGDEADLNVDVDTARLSEKTLHLVALIADIWPPGKSPGEKSGGRHKDGLPPSLTMAFGRLRRYKTLFAS